MRNFKEIIRIRNSKKGNGNIEVFRDLVLYSAFNIYIFFSDKKLFRISRRIFFFIDIINRILILK